MSIELAPEQLKAISEMHNGCILKGGVGSGKSITALVYFFERVCDGAIVSHEDGMRLDYIAMKKPRDLYIITTAKKRDETDWEKEAAKLALSTKRELSFEGVQVTVDSWNNMGRYTDVKEAFFIFDEQRLVGSGAWVKAFYKIAEANQWVMLSATPGDVWLDYAPVFIANGFYRNITEFRRRHVVYRHNPHGNYFTVDHYVEEGRLNKLRRQTLVEMPFERHTKRHVQRVQVSYDKETYEVIRKKRWNPYTQKPIKDVSERAAVTRKLVNSDVSRIGELMVLIEKHPKLIVFYNYDYELEILRTLVGVLSLPYAEWNGHKHEPIPGHDRWVYLVQYTAGAEAWECIETDAMAFWSLNYSYKINEQCKGRIDRRNTPYIDLYYYLLVSDSPLDMGILKSLGAKRDFNEKAFFEGLG